jgi:hypothetical protein
MLSEGFFADKNIHEICLIIEIKGPICYFPKKIKFCEYTPKHLL